MKSFISPQLNNIVPYTPGEQPQGENIVKLNTNESPFPPSPLVVKAVTEASDQLRLYPDPFSYPLIKKLAQAERVEENQIAVSNGSDEMLAFCFQGFCGDGAVFPNITYSFYEVYCSLYFVQKTLVKLNADFTIPIERFAGLKSTVFIANPNAPTGVFLPLDKIKTLLEQDRSRLVVVDEAYIDFGGESAVRLVEHYDNLLVIKTFSKSRSLAGARLGYAVGSESIIADINRIRFSFNSYNVGVMNMAAGIASLEDSDYFEVCRSEIIKTRGFMTQQLSLLGFKVINSKANFIFAGEHELIHARVLYERLKKKGIYVRYFDREYIDNFLRITVGTMSQAKLLAEEIKKELLL